MDVSKHSKQKKARRERAHRRVRTRVSGTTQRPRLAVYKSGRYIYAQVIDDAQGATLAAASSLEPTLKQQLKGSRGNRAAAKLVGETVAQRAREKGVEQVVFDRGGYIYHGIVKALAEAAREKGLDF